MLYYCRPSGGAEIDLVLRISSRELWAIKIKHGVAPRIKTGLHRASEDIRATRKFVVYGGHDEFPVGTDATVVFLSGLMGKLIDL